MPDVYIDLDKDNLTDGYQLSIGDLVPVKGCRMTKPLLCLDFDGVLHSYTSGWKGARVIPDPPVDGAIKFLLEASDCFDVAIHSSRSRYWGGRRAMKNWLHGHISKYFWQLVSRAESIDESWTAADIEEQISLVAQGVVKRIAFPLWKPPAHVTIDDRAITFTGAWPDLDYLKSFKPWNRKPEP